MDNKPEDTQSIDEISTALESQYMKAGNADIKIVKKKAVKRAK